MTNDVAREPQVAVVDESDERWGLLYIYVDAYIIAERPFYRFVSALVSMQLSNNKRAIDANVERCRMTTV